MRLASELPPQRKNSSCALGACFVVAKCHKHRKGHFPFDLSAQFQ